MRRIAILGTGGMGREAHAWAIDCGFGQDLVGFLDQDVSLHGAERVGLPVLGGIDWLDNAPNTNVILALGSPGRRSAVMAELDRRGVALATVVHPTAVIGPGVRIGSGSIICPGVVLTTDITVGRAAIVNFGAMVGHDSHIGDAAFIAPGVHVAGNVTMGDRADIGIGASIIPGVTIGSDARVGAGAVVVRDVEAGVTVMGVPARPRLDSP